MTSSTQNPKSDSWNQMLRTTSARARGHSLWQQMNGRNETLNLMAFILQTERAHFMCQLSFSPKQSRKSRTLSMNCALCSQSFSVGCILPVSWKWGKNPLGYNKKWCGWQIATNNEHFMRNSLFSRCTASAQSVLLIFSYEKVVIRINRREREQTEMKSKVSTMLPDPRTFAYQLSAVDTSRASSQARWRWCVCSFVSILEWSAWIKNSMNKVDGIIVIWQIEAVSLDLLCRSSMMARWWSVSLMMDFFFPPVAMNLNVNACRHSLNVSTSILSASASPYDLNHWMTWTTVRVLLSLAAKRKKKLRE